MKELELRCEKCRRFLNIKAVDSIIAQIRCPNQKCKFLNNIKVVNFTSSKEALRYKFPVNTS